MTVSRQTRGAAGDGEEGGAAGGLLTGDLYGVDVQDLLFLESNLRNSDDPPKHLSLTRQQLLSVLDRNGRLFIAVSDEPDHGQSLLHKLVSGVRAPTPPESTADQ